MVFMPNTTSNPFRFSQKWGLFASFSSLLRLFFFLLHGIFDGNFSRVGVCWGLDPRNVLELETIRGLIFFRGISHTSNMVTMHTLELLKGWKSWRWEILEVPPYIK